MSITAVVPAHYIVLPGTREILCVYADGSTDLFEWK